MKSFMKTLYLLILGFLFLSCSSDDEVSSNPLSQTTWKGTETVTDGEIIIRIMDVEMQFFTAKAGQYIIKESGQGPEVYNFNYSITDKIMDIDNGPLSSKRTLLEINEKYMKMEALNSYKSTLVLNREY